MTESKVLDFIASTRVEHDENDVLHKNLETKRKKILRAFIWIGCTVNRFTVP